MIKCSKKSILNDICCTVYALLFLHFLLRKWFCLLLIFLSILINSCIGAVLLVITSLELFLVVIDFVVEPLSASGGHDGFVVLCVYGCPLPSENYLHLSDFSLKKTTNASF